MFAFKIGEGYYGIVTDGVSVDPAVALRIDKAFEDAKGVPVDLTIRPAGASQPSKDSLRILK